MSEHNNSPADSAGEMPNQSKTRRRRGARVWVPLALIGCLVVAGAAAAATGAFSVGDEIPAGGDSNLRPETRLPVDEQVIATGSSPIAGEWTMTAYKSSQSEGQAAGLPCIRLVLLDPPDGSPLDGSGFCGEVKSDFGAVSVPVANSDGESELLVFGIAPTDTGRVEIQGQDGPPVSAPASSGGPDFTRADVFLMVVPSDAKQGPLVAIGQDGTASEKTVRTDGFFDRLRMAERMQAGG